MLNDRAFFLFSDGSCNLHLVDKDSLKEVQRKCITDPANGNEPLKNVNALQFVKGKVLANVWMEDRIAVISWEKGMVERWIDFSFLKRLRKVPEDDWSRQNAVFNGIAYDEEKDCLYVTGKFWNRLFQVRVL